MLRKHKNNRDVAIEILKAFFVRETKTFKLKVQWWNIGRCHAPFPMNIHQSLEIPLAKWSEWEPYTWTRQDPVRHMVDWPSG